MLPALVGTLCLLSISAGRAGSHCAGSRETVRLEELLQRQGPMSRRAGIAVTWG